MTVTSPHNRRELENRLKAPNAQERDKVAQNAALKEFADAAGEQLRSLRTEANRCKALYEECAEFYGESAKTVDANTFFGYLVSASSNVHCTYYQGGLHQG